MEPTSQSPTEQWETHPRAWYLQPRNARWLGPLLIVVCVALRFGWGGVEGPPFPFWGIAYLAGAAGIFLTYLAWAERGTG